MSRPLRTNAAYAHLAYQKAIRNREIIFLRRTYLADELSDPRETLVCEEVFPQDQQVPQEAIQHRIEELTHEMAQLDIELHKFQLVPVNQGRHEQKVSKNRGKQGPQSGTPSRQGGRHH